MGNLNHRAEVIGLIRGLPQATLATDDEVLPLIEQEALYGPGLDYVDAQLLGATWLTPDTALWTRDKRLSTVATRLGLSFQPAPHPGSRR